MFENVFSRFSNISFRENTIWKQRATSLILCDSLKQYKITVSATNSISLSYCGHLSCVQRLCHLWKLIGIGEQRKTFLRGKKSWKGNTRWEVKFLREFWSRNEFFEGKFAERKKEMAGSEVSWKKRAALVLPRGMFGHQVSIWKFSHWP